VAVPEIIQVENMVKTGNFNNPQRGRVYSSNGISPSLNTVGGGGLEPKILVAGNVSAIVNNKPLSNSQQYKMAGNSIVVDSMEFLKNLEID